LKGISVQTGLNQSVRSLTLTTRLSLADEWVTQLLRQGDSQVFKRYSQMKLQMKREALEKINRQANEMPLDSGTAMVQ
jgi:hypothetical protein